MPIQKITPFLWFDHQAEEAANFYTPIFPNSKIIKVIRYGKNSPGPAGSVMTVEFQLEGQTFVALNGGPIFKFTEALSFVVNCQSQDEVDRYWEKLSASGNTTLPMQKQTWGDEFGMVVDKFGITWLVNISQPQA